MISNFSSICSTTIATIATTFFFPFENGIVTTVDNVGVHSHVVGVLKYHVVIIIIITDGGVTHERINSSAVASSQKITCTIVVERRGRIGTASGHYPWCRCSIHKLIFGSIRCIDQIR